MQLSIIVVSYNVKYFLEQCLFSVIAACKNIEAEIFVVDNASSDNSIEFLKPKFPEISFIKNNANLGFAKANNEALKLAKGNYILYLNPDTILSEDILTNCIRFLNNNTSAGAIGVKMIDGSGHFLPESKRAFPSVSASFWKMNGMASLFKKSAVFNRYALGNLSEDEVHEVDILCGAFLMSRRNILLELNGFDEDYFMYGEDIDLSYRIQKLGYKNFYLGDNTIIHFKGKSTQKRNAEYRRKFYNAMKIFVVKHHKKPVALFLNWAIDISKFLTSLRQNVFHTRHQKISTEFLMSGDSDAIVSAEKILVRNNYTSKNVGLTNLSSALHKPNVVLCTNESCYKQHIGFTQKNKSRFLYFWHHKNAESIAGSNFRNTTGEIIY